MVRLSRTGASGPDDFTGSMDWRPCVVCRLAARMLRPRRLAEAWPLRLAPGEVAGLLPDGQRICPRRRTAYACVFSHPTLEGASQSCQLRYLS
ncbi:DUF1731 domain-containing protein [Massilia sp. PAMC28688]|nr:DUF1731 domain-containing protein [Massilia sp. PAMC28688]